MKSRSLLVATSFKRIVVNAYTTISCSTKKIMSKSRLERMSSHITAMSTPMSNGSDETGSTAYKFKEIRIPVPWGHIAAKEWGNPGKDSRRILGLHGWQDNCNTFDPLIPLLLPDLNLHFVAIDLPGHGLSSHRPSGTFYHMFDYVADVKRVIRHLRWESGFSCVAHSMGAAIAMSYSACFVDEVDRIVLFDSVVPMSRKVQNLPAKMAASIRGLFECEKVSPIRGVDLEYAVRLVVDSMAGSVSDRGARVLLERGSRPTKEDPKKVIFTRDQRLKVDSMPGVTREQSLAMANSVRADTLIILASQGLVHNGPYLQEEIDDYCETFTKNCRSFRLVDVEGTHHVHLNNPERVAKYLREFFAK